ncbi:MAG TPA: tetratricopeptide repeat protein [Casimicrobiaceae bacterium]|nr:tetratricopeptide repeat protein [Casimicrobiaceae bacterium]
MSNVAARCLVAAFAALCAAAALAQLPASRAQALESLDDAVAERRAHAVIWFAQNGGPADDKLLLPHLGDENPIVRELAEQGMWVLWTRSGDNAVDALMTRGAEQMQARDFAASIATYSEVIRRKPAFAEGWNKRATARFLAGDFKRSLADCAEVMKRNPYHFGALSGYGQIYFELRQYDKAIEYWQRALKVNPNLESLNQNIEIARKRLAETRKNST